MSVESFLKLKEIDSLTKMRINHLKTKNEQEDRLSKLNERRQTALEQSTTLKKEIVTIHRQMGDLEGQLKTASEQKQRLKDIGSDEEKINRFTCDITRLEDEGLTLLSRVEEIEKELSEEKIFLSGLEKTISEIEKEVTEEVQKMNQEITNIDLRLNLLQDELPPDFKSLFLKTTAKKLAHGPFTRMDQGHCYFCRFKISRTEESEIDMLQKLKTCPQCDRIFLPYGA